MPQLVAALIIGAGIYAGLNWLSKALARKARHQHDKELGRQGANAHREPRDLGTLEYDPATETYRPRDPRGV